MLLGLGFLLLFVFFFFLFFWVIDFIIDACPAYAWYAFPAAFIPGGIIFMTGICCLVLSVMSFTGAL